MRTRILSAALAVAIAGLPGQLISQDRVPLRLPERELVARARGIHERVMTLDTHVDISVQRAPQTYTQPFLNQVNLVKMDSGGLDAVFFSIYVGQNRSDSAFTEESYDRAYRSAVEKVLWVYGLTQGVAPDRIGLARSSAEARAIHASGRKVAFMGMENAYPLGEDLGNIRKFADLGIRYISLSHNGHSQFSDANDGEQNGWKWNGLSPLGKQAIAEMNKWGVMIDFSHPSKQAMLQMIELSRAPIMGSHSGARAICNHSRNADDEQLLALKRNGGVIQLVAFASYVKCDNDARQARQEEITALNAEYGITGRGGRGGGGRGGRGGGGRGGRAGGGGGGGGGGRGAGDSTVRVVTVDSLAPQRRAEYQQKLAAIEAKYPSAQPATVKDFVDHIDYTVKLIGIDHVGISSDFDGGGGVEGWDDATETFNVTLELVRRGYSEQEIEQIWSGNLLRVLDEVQRIARQLQAEANPG